MSRRAATAVKRPSRRSGGDAANYLVIGKVLRPHGVRGELRLEIQTDSPGHLRDVETVYVGADHRAYPLESFRLHNGVLLLTLAGVSDRQAADRLRGELVAVGLADAAPLKEGEYYHRDIIGLQVLTDLGEDLGRVVEIIQTGANDVYVARGAAGDVLLPAIRSVILKIEPPQIIVHLLDGLGPDTGSGKTAP